tara:strand:- start:72213 stop:72380 length:168 start_codon:yes stop_codon:yes gene_type:complete
MIKTIKFTEFNKMAVFIRKLLKGGYKQYQFILTDRDEDNNIVDEHFVLSYFMRSK